MKIVYIHGANASGNSFNYIRENLQYNDELVLEYDSREGFDYNLDKLYTQLQKYKDIFFVCHSLGGIYAVYLADKLGKKVLESVTLSTPYGGAEVANYAKYFFPFNRLIRDVGSHSVPIKNLDKIKIQHPWTQIVTTKGESLWIHVANDGVVTVNSQQHRNDMDFIDLHINHYEVVMSPRVVEIIKNKISKYE
jgi:hypothetical protein